MITACTISNFFTFVMIMYFTYWINIRSISIIYNFFWGHSWNRTSSTSFADQSLSMNNMTISSPKRIRTPIYWVVISNSIQLNYRTKFARLRGFEPRTTVLETGMIPFHYRRKMWLLEYPQSHQLCRPNVSEVKLCIVKRHYLSSIPCTSGCWVKDGFRTHDLLNHNQTL